MRDTTFDFWLGNNQLHISKQIKKILLYYKIFVSSRTFEILEEKKMNQSCFFHQHFLVILRRKTNILIINLIYSEK